MNFANLQADVVYVIYRNTNMHSGSRCTTGTQTKKRFLMSLLNQLLMQLWTATMVKMATSLEMQASGLLQPMH